MAYKVVRTRAAIQDLGLIFDHLVESYTTFGEPISVAVERASVRLRGIDEDMGSLSKAPYQGTLLPEILDGVRSVTKNNAVFYFLVDDASEEIRVLAVFFGGQDHRRHMLTRMK